MSLAKKIASLLDSAGLLTIDRLPQGMLQGLFKNLKITNGATPASQVIVTADYAVLVDASGGFKSFSTVSVTASSASTGANALDAGAVANSTWYAIWLIGKSDGTIAALLSTSATAPTMPSGYTFKSRFGWVRTGSTGNFVRFIQYGRSARYQVVAGSETPGLPIFLNSALGNPTTPTYVSADLSAFVPSTASKINVLLRATTTGGGGARFLLVSPSNQYSALGATNPAVASSVALDTGAMGISPNYSMHDIQFETAQTLYVASNAACYGAVYGWEDNI